MLGYMNDEAIRKTKKTGNVTFYSRTKKRLWTKGEESGNFLRLVNMKVDCDNDTILIYVNDNGWEQSPNEDYTESMEYSTLGLSLIHI